MPYKKDVIPYCDILSPAAKMLGAVNTIVRMEDGKLLGHNTDYAGFETMLRLSNLSVKGKKVLVLGSGGASVTVCAVLHHHEADPVVISRTGENNYSNLEKHADAAVIVNATPVGMFPNVGISPIDLSLFPDLEGVLDLVYNPCRTQLILDAEARGLTAMNGLLMLVAQAKESAEWFTRTQIPYSIVHQIHRSLRMEAENVILIGMPGCGKSTVGKLLAEMLHKTFVDCDEWIEGRAGIPIPQIFENAGEAGFRALESQVLSEISRRSGQVIATGGGCVTKEENYAPLHQNGTIVWIQRDSDLLATQGRPLSQNADLNAMYAQRRPMYRRFADVIVQNSNSPEETAMQIIRLLEESL
jgi:shikimate dehydrogenase